MKKIFAVCLTFVMILFSGIAINSYNLIDLVKEDGSGYVTYRGEQIRVQIPDVYEAPDTDFRGVWISTMTGDIARYYTVTQYKDEINSVFAVMEHYNLNAMVFHIRIYNDALYDSSLNKISPYYQNADFQNWDPLTWIIDECHKRGIEFHAWMNPYRVKSSGVSDLEDYAKTEPDYNIASNPEYLLQSGNSVILNPGEPAVRDFIVDTCLEVVEKYDVDAIHFDDYFYIEGVNDAETRAKYNTEGLSLADFRRKQVDLFIEQLSEALYDFNFMNNRVVQIGISPTGIYRNGSYSETAVYDENGNLISPIGSNTSGLAHYEAYLYCDTKKWIDNEWIDYIIPQSYWSFEHNVAAYADVMDWWDKVVEYKNVNLYSGMGIYRVLDYKTNWYNKTEEALNELKYGIKLKNVSGHCIYSYKHIKYAYQGGTNNYYYEENFRKVREEAWTHKAIMPEIRSYNPVKLPDVKNLTLSVENNKNILTFDHNPYAKFYVIYRSDRTITYSSDEVYDIIGTDKDVASVTYTDEDFGSYHYAVRVMSKTNTLSDGATIASDFYIVTFKNEDGSIIETKAVEPGGTVTPPFVAKEGYDLIGWSESLTAISTDLEVYPIFEIKQYTVTFIVDNAVYAEKMVDYGSGVDIEPPEKTGYRFVKWDKDIDCITGDLQVKAVFAINIYTVLFFDYDGILLSTEYVMHGDDATPPDINRDSFSGWDFDYTDVTSDLTITAQYDNIYLITFMVDGEVYIEKRYLPGDVFIPPAIPEKDGYNQTAPAWSITDFSDIEENTIVHVIYIINVYTVTFLGFNNEVLKNELVEHGSDATAPDIPEIDGYSFESWHKDFTDVTDDMTVKAKYKEDDTPGFSFSCSQFNFIQGFSLLAVFVFLIFRRRH